VRVAEIGEINLVERLRSLSRQEDESLQIGIGDDCAVIRRPDGKAWLLTTDCLVEDVHFRPAFMTLEELGAKAVAVNVSDIAAMGGTPRFVLVTICLPDTTPVADVEALYRGIRRSCEHYTISLVGGDTACAPHMLLSLVLIGEQDEELVVARSGAFPGDTICVTGTLGDAALGLALLEEGVRADGASTDVQWLLHRHVAPLPRLLIGRRIAEEGLATSMIDISDGLATSSASAGLQGWELASNSHACHAPRRLKSSPRLEASNRSSWPSLVERTTSFCSPFLRRSWRPSNERPVGRVRESPGSEQ
jgi:thiamine-monophosphate kinase